jgi:hypothetical protein
MTTNTKFTPKVLTGVEIFRAGTFLDSEGVPFTADSDIFEKFLNNFKTGTSSIPIKIGHTSDEFNAQIAEELGIPATILRGDAGGRGAAKLGEVTSLHANGKLTADIVLSNEKVANLISQGYFTDVSVELVEDAEHGPTLTGVALLGKERPAVSNLAKLQKATLLNQGYKFDKLFLFSLPETLQVSEQQVSGEDTNIENITTAIKQMSEALTILKGVSKIHMSDKDKAEAKIAEAEFAEDDDDDTEDDPDNPGTKRKKKVKEEEAKMTAPPQPAVIDSKFMANLATMLNLKSNATENDILLAAKELKDNVTTVTQNFSKTDEAVHAMQTKLRVYEFMEQTAKFTSIPGQPREYAEKLADIEAKAGPEMAQYMLKQFEQQQAIAEELKLTKGTLSPGDPNKNTKTYTFEEKARKLADEQKITFEKAMSQLAVANMKEFSDYRSEKMLDFV